MLNKWREFSATERWAGLVGGLYPEPKVETELPEDLRTELLPALEPTAARLEEQRKETVERIDRRARRMIPLGLSPLLLVFLPGVGLGLPLILAIAGGCIAWGAAARAPAAEWQKQMSEGFGQTLSQRLSGFAHVALPEPDPARLDALRLFGKVRKVDVADRLAGHRDGRDLALSTMRVMYSPNKTFVNAKRDSPILFCDMVEVETTAADAPLIVGVGNTAYDVLRDTPETVHKLARFTVEDPVFSKTFHLFSSDPQAALGVLDEELRAALLTLSENHGHEPPHFVIMPGYMAILFPRLSLQKVFQSRPYWVPVDAERTLAQFSSDLAGRNAMIEDVLSVPIR